MSSETNPDLDDWLNRFGGSLGVEEAKKQFEYWKELHSKVVKLKEILLRYPAIDFSSAQDFLNRAVNVLRYDEDYRVVIIGETGAGKSTLLNSLLQDKLLLTGSGAAITGTAIYVYPNQDIEHDRADIVLRSRDEFKSLLISLLSRYFDEKDRKVLFKNEEKLTADKFLELANNSYFLAGLGKTLSDNEKQAIQYEILDIAKTWKEIDHIDRNTKKEFMVPEELEVLNSYLEEEGSLNTRGSDKRIIPAIKYAKLYLKDNTHSYLSRKISSSVVFIDVPGSAAKTLRHAEILRQEVKNANAIVLVVKPDRPAEQGGTSIANLLEQCLFNDYTPQEKKKFSSKVFLVINKIDQVKTEEDESRLNTSLMQLCEIIGDKGLLDSRCIRVVAEKSILALILRKELKIKSDKEKEYYAGLAKCSIEDLANVDIEKLEKESGIPILLEKLSNFLSQERVHLIVDEGQVLLEKSINNVKSICSRAIGLEAQLADTSHLEKISIKEKSFCEWVLDQDEKDLDKARGELIKSVQMWIKTGEHQEKVSHKITSIFTDLKDSIKEPAKHLLDPENHKEGALHNSTSFITARSYTNIDVPFLLLETEMSFHRAIEDHTKELADYYFHEFESQVDSLNIDTMLDQKSYDQAYIEEIAPSSSMKKVRKQVHENLQAICRWVLMYELLKMPIDLPLDPSKDEMNQNLSVQAFKEAFKEISPDLIALGNDAIQGIVDSILPLPLKKLIEVFSNLINEESEKQVTGNPELQVPDRVTIKREIIQTRPDKLFDKAELEQKVIEYGSNEDIDRLIELLQEQFAFRYSVAISTALLYLERLFQYELGKYCCRLEEISKKLIKKHRGAVDLNVGDIREQLTKKHPDISQKFQEAANCLRETLSL